MVTLEGLRLYFYCGNMAYLFFEHQKGILCLETVHGGGTVNE